MIFNIPQLILSFCLASCAIAAALQGQESHPASPIPPTQDPFYTAPHHFELSTPGKVLRFRSAPGNLSSMFGNCSAAYNILYRTTNSRYRSSWAVTTLFVPKVSAANGYGSSLLSYQIPYNSLDLDSSPSYALYEGPASYPDISAALSRGWYVSVPDFEGPLASVLSGPQEGHATLDSVRAVLSTHLGLKYKARYALWGYSGGSVASEWAAELQKDYAPELFFSGMAIGGMPANVSSSLQQLLSSELARNFAGLVPAVLLGMTNQYPDVQEWLIGQLKTTGPYNKTTFLAVEKMNFNEEFAAFANQNIAEYFIHGENTFSEPILQNILLKDGTMGYHGVPQMPIFAYKAIADEIAPTSEVDALLQKYCDRGVNILYQRNTLGGHLAEYTNGNQRAFAWLDTVLDGNYTDTHQSRGCVVQNVTVGIDLSPL